jgi:hypothetical protein
VTKENYLKKMDGLELPKISKLKIDRWMDGQMDG